MRDTYTDSTGTSAVNTAAIEQGWEVYGDDDKHLGNVEGMGQGYLLIQKGLIFTTDIYVPFTAVTDAADGVVRVNVGKDELESMGWDAPPTGGAADGQSWAGSASDGGAGATGSGATGYETGEYGSSQYGTTGSGDSGDADRARMALHEEELEARTTARQTGEVELRKEVVEDRQTIEVPVQREEVHVRRVPAGSHASADDASFSEGETLRVPVMEEEVEVTKRPVVREEVEVEKVTRQDTEQVSDTVRREELQVSGATADEDLLSEGQDRPRPRGRI